MSIFMKALRNAENQTVEMNGKNNGLINAIVAHCEANCKDVHSYIGAYGEKTMYKLTSGELVKVLHNNGVVKSVELI